MSAVLGLAPEKVREICAAVAAETGGVVSPANYNEPAQTVIAGAAGPVEKAGERLKAAGAKRVLPLPVSAPFHCALMAPVKARLEPVLRAIPWRRPLVPVVTNVEAAPNQDPARIVPLLVEQVTAPVRWVECVEQLARQGVTRIVEVGPGAVLSGLAKRIDRSLQVWNVEDPASLEKTLAALRA
jgi:[acyl-carrier-protein] S-malonyltransferase